MMGNQRSTPARKYTLDERGITALETASILIAFIVGATIFAFTILAAGVFSTERAEDSVLAGLDEVQSTIELRGKIVSLASTSGMTGTVGSLVFTVANALDGRPIPLDPDGDGVEKIVIQYFDKTQRNTDLSWAVVWLVNDGDKLLENGELAEITITNLDTQLTNPLSVNTQFTLELMPPWGNVLSLTRTTPPVIDQAFTFE